jgi:SAM-dependent methyltransferase
VFEALAALAVRPALYSRSTTPELWTDPHLSARMLAAHLDPDVDSSSYRLDHLKEVAAWLVERFGIGAGVRVADFGCGPGLYTTRFARAGAEVTGIDLSARSLAHAARLADEAGVRVRYVRADYLAYRERTRFDLITLIMRDYCALSPDDRGALLRTVRAHLAPGGSFAFDVDAAAAFDSVREQAGYAPRLMDGFWAPGPYAGFHHTHRYPEARVSLDRYDIFEPSRHRAFFNWVRYFTPDELRAELRAAGFGTVEILGDLAGGRYEESAPSFAAVAREDAL